MPGDADQSRSTLPCWGPPLPWRASPVPPPSNPSQRSAQTLHRGGEACCGRRGARPLAGNQGTRMRCPGVLIVMERVLAHHLVWHIVGHRSRWDEGIVRSKACPANEERNGQDEGCSSRVQRLSGHSAPHTRPPHPPDPPGTTMPPRPSFQARSCSVN